MSIESTVSIKSWNPFTVFIVFAIGIILPGGVLSYLGFRSFHYEGLLLQKQAEERYAGVADLIQKKVSERLLNLVEDLRVLANHDSIDRLNIAEMAPLVLEPHTLAGLPVDNVFVFDDQGQLLIPWPSEPPRATTIAVRDIDWGSLREEVEEAERKEFIEKNYLQAIDAYKRIQRRARQSQQQAVLLKDIAGCYRKLHDSRGAETDYIILSRDYDQVLDLSGLPMGILARRLLIQMYDEDKLGDRAIDARLELFEKLIFQQWKITLLQENLLREDLTGAIEKDLSKHTAETVKRMKRWQQSQRLEHQLQALKPVAESFASRWPNLFKRLRDRGWLDQGGVFQLSSNDSKNQAAVVFPIVRGTEARPHGFVVACVPADSLWPELEQSMIEIAEPVGLQLSWDHASAQLESGKKTISGLLKPILHRQVMQIDPPLALSLQDVSDLGQDFFSRRRRKIFGGMVGLSFIVILVGLVVMGKAVQREREVANLKSDFVANVSHELRTPLTAISHIGERLSLGRFQPGEAQEFYGMLAKETQRLQQLVEDVLDFSKVLAGKKVYKQDPLDLVTLVQETSDRFDRKANAKGFDVLLHLSSEPIPMVGDRPALMHAVLNLLDNALKYSGKSKKIDVHVYQDASHAIVAVQDYGIGIAEDDQPKIFEKFYRVEHSLSIQSEGGVGLGLAMVKHIVEGHLGTIRVESFVGQGSTFILEFPLGGK